MKSSIQQLVNDLRDGIGSCPILYISHYDESLIDRAVKMAMEKLRENPKLVSEWDCDRGEIDFETKNTAKRKSDYGEIGSVVDYLTNISAGSFRGPNGGRKKVFIIKNLFYSSSNLLWPDSKSLTACFSLLQLFSNRYFNNKNNKENDEGDRWCIILFNTYCQGCLPPAISKIATVVNVLPPTFDEIGELLKEFKCDALSDEKRRELIRNLQGLDEYEIKQILRSITVFNDGQITSDCIPKTLEAKKRLIKKYGVIEIVDADEDFEQIGGLEVLRRDLEQKSLIFRNVNCALDDGISMPKGILIIGMPGCGKTMIAKAIANEFGKIPLLRLDMNRILGSYVGESEQNMNRVLLTAEAASPCVLWIDEIEKAFSGASSTGDSNNDTVLRMMGLFLTWMQEHKKPVYIVATANDVMRSEFMRKGRFDEVYFVDFPTEDEVKAILQKILTPISTAYSGSVKFDISDLSSDLDTLKREASGFTGAEIRSAINSLVESAYADHLKELEKPSYVKTGKPSIIKLSKERLLEIIGEMKNNITQKQAADENSSVAKLQKYRKMFKSASK